LKLFADVFNLHLQFSDFLRKQFESYNLHVIYMLSENYYNSAAALNEMGAAWILKMRYDTILLPGFEYKSIEGAVDPRVISLKLDADVREVKGRLNELKRRIESEFSIADPKPDGRWEDQREKFMEGVAEVTRCLKVGKFNNNLITPLDNRHIFDDMTEILWSDENSQNDRAPLDRALRGLDI
ncbi:MAG: hypothetical protein LUD78_00635, partial [Clostridiales bacterium]|nr:hypothetical protein [Clostridiales bacterium]